MIDLQKDFWQIVEDVTEASEQFFQDVGQVIEDVTEVTLEIIVDIEQLVRDFQDVWEPTHDRLDAIAGWSEEEFLFYESFEDPDLLINPKVEPTLANYPACMGCRHYHGRVYHGNLLVCAMHPFGWDDKNCPDWQGLQ
jgi:hypothetical protein